MKAVYVSDARMAMMNSMWVVVAGLLLISVDVSKTDDGNKKTLLNPYRYKFIIEGEPCTERDELLIVVHTSTKVCQSANISIIIVVMLYKEQHQSIVAENNISNTNEMVVLIYGRLTTRCYIANLVHSQTRAFNQS